MSNQAGTFFKTSLWRWLCVAMLAGYGIFVGTYYCAVAGGSDSSGYANSARLLAAGKLTVERRAVPELAGSPWNHLIPLGFVGKGNESRIVPTYPVGLPLHLALVSTIVGWHWGPILVGVFAAVAALALTYGCARELDVAPPIAFACAASLAVSPLFLFCALQMLSDALATTWCIAAFYAALRGRRSTGWAVASGAALAVAVFTRVTDAMLLPALVLVLWHWKKLLAAAIGGLPGAIALGAYQNALYGGPLTSGYGAIYTMFERQYLVSGLAYFAQWILWLAPVCWLAAPLAFFAPWRRSWREVTALGVWFFAFVIFYALYPISQGVWWALRFILPAFPAAVILAGVGLEGLVRKFAAVEKHAALWRAGAAATAFAVALVFSIHWSPRLAVLHLRESVQAYEDASKWAAKNIPRESVVACMYFSGSLYYYSELPILRWDQITPEQFAQDAAAFQKSGRPLYALLFPGETEANQAFREHLPGEWVKITEVSGAGIWRLGSAPGAKSSTPP